MKSSLFKLVTVVTLIAFASVSLVFAALQEVQRATALAAEQPAAESPSSAGLEALKAGKEQTPVFYATYYHGNARCPTCMKIEAYSQEAIETRFAEEVKSGIVVFRLVNYDDKGNEHFKKDYELAAQSLIISEVSGNKELRWNNLEKVWDLTYDKDKFIQYVEDEFRTFMAVKGKTIAGTAQATPLASADTPRTVNAAANTPAAKHIVVYYLHGDARCPSCVKIETFADAAVHERFANEITAGQVEWRAVNYDKPENNHYWKDFGLEVKTVVVEQLVDGKQVRFKRLDDVWYLLDDEQKFADFIETEVRQYLEGAA